MLLICGFILTLGLIGCGGGGTTSDTSTPSQIVITPGTASVIYNGGTRQFTAVCTDSNSNIINADFIWSVEPSNMGTINENGIFTAGTEKGSCTVSCSYSGLSADATVNITGLKDAGQQIVNDTQTVWGNLETPITGLNNILMDTQTKFMTDLQYVNAPLSTFGRYINFGFLAKLYRFTPNTYNINLILQDTSSNPYNEGSWTVIENDWTVQITRAISGSIDNVTFTIANESDGQLNYYGSFSYRTIILDNPMSELQDNSVDLKFEDQHLNGTATTVGTVHYDGTEHTATFNANLDFRFKDGEQINYTGDWKITLDATDKDYLKGTFTTANLIIDGEIDIEYAENTNMSEEFFGLFLKSFTLNGTIKNKATTPVILSGALNCTISNADTINPKIPESVSNCLKGSVTFQGSIENEQNKLDAKIIGQQTEYQKYVSTIEYNLNNGGVARECSLVVSNPTAGDYNNLHLEINSDWGPASIVMDIEMSTYGSIQNITSGSVTCNGTQIGTIVLLEEGLIQVKYNNDTFETL